MDIEKLISEVRSHPSLWDKKRDSYLNRDLSRISWHEISETLKRPILECKTKWGNLRDSFKKEINKLTKMKTEDEITLPLKSSWKHFKDLLFLLDNCNWRETSGGNYTDEDLIDPIAVNETLEGFSDSIQLSSTKYLPSTSKIISDIQPIIPCKKKKVAKHDDFENKLLKFERKQMEIYEKNENDADRMFLLSLLPYFKKVPDERKIFLRQTIQGAIINEMTASTSTQSINSSTQISIQSPNRSNSTNITKDNEKLEQQE